MFRGARYSLVTKNNSRDAGGRGDVSHETLHRQWSVGSRREKQGGERKQRGRREAKRRGKDARSGIMHLSCILLSILNQYLIYIIYSLHNEAGTLTIKLSSLRTLSICDYYLCQLFLSSS